MNSENPIQRRNGFTLVEILIVVAILGILTALVLLPNVLRSRLIANDSVARATLKTISTALESYYSINNSYPPDTVTLVTSTPSYLLTDFFDGTGHSGFTYNADVLTDFVYSITATPVSTSQGSGSFTISTGGILTAN